MSTARKLILSVIYVVLVVGLSLAIILSFTHNKSSTPKVNKPTITQHSQAATSGSKPKSTTSSSSSSQSASTASNLTNTGPGDDIAIFVSVTLFASITHWLVRRHKLYLN